MFFVPFCTHSSFSSTCKTNNTHTLIQTISVQRAVTNFEHVWAQCQWLSLAYIIRCHYYKRSPIAEILKCACWNWWDTAFSFKGASWNKLAVWSVSSSFAYSLHCSNFIKLCSLSSPFTFSPWTMSVTWRTFTVSWFPSLHFHPFLDSCAPDTVFSYLLDICIPQTVCEPNWIP